ncbi:MAG: hypothetical protein H7Y04_00400 [Verrucomicrobia bacterium]|nr:hypothetical protein [Cytophagales bacterium]
MRTYNLRKTVLRLTFGLLLVSLIGLVVMTLWNQILVPTMDVKMLNLGQGVGLFLLFRILTGGIFSMWGWQHYRRNWKKNWAEKFSGMNEEEREKFRQLYLHQCGNKSRYQQTNTSIENTIDLAKAT